MTLKEAIKIICDYKHCFLVKKFVKNYKKYNREQKYYCKKHNKCHKYTFHSRIELIPSTAFFLGVDSAKEVINFAKTL